jgi:hypothetical protein
MGHHEFMRKASFLKSAADQKHIAVVIFRQ